MVLRNNVPVSQAIWLGSEIQPRRAGLVIKQEADLVVGQVALFTADAEGSIYKYPYTGDRWQIPLFISSCVVVFEPGAVPPMLNPAVNTYAGGTVLSPVQGMDVAQGSNYYAPIVRSGAFQAPSAGLWTFCLYMWGGANGAGSGNAAWVYNNTAQMTVVTL